MTKALLLIDHGSTQNEANLLIEALTDLLRKMRPELIIHCAHMDIAKPTIAEGFEKCVNAGATEIVAHPYMLAPGRHARQDVPRMLNELALKHPSVTVRVSEPLGLHEKIAEVVLERAGF